MQLLVPCGFLRIFLRIPRLILRQRLVAWLLRLPLCRLGAREFRRQLEGPRRCQMFQAKQEPTLGAVRLKQQAKQALNRQRSFTGIDVFDYFCFCF